MLWCFFGSFCLSRINVGAPVPAVLLLQAEHRELDRKTTWLRGHCQVGWLLITSPFSDEMILSKSQQWNHPQEATKMLAVTVILHQSFLDHWMWVLCSMEWEPSVFSLTTQWYQIFIRSSTSSRSCSLNGQTNCFKDRHGFEQETLKSSNGLALYAQQIAERRDGHRCCCWDFGNRECTAHIELHNIIVYIYIYCIYIYIHIHCYLQIYLIVLEVYFFGWVGAFLRFLHERKTASFCNTSLRCAWMMQSALASK